ncbi:helix-turn-helix domain-containing protein [Winogradskyella sp. UBA3174]|uniref:helix-turn-helix domain-containing protein n=1 Tax=Winogradskyella sp. UBA3174 TaxID=1947785 RepID=UPI0025FCB4A6|nr:helix-turn-helix transcriptional regulator [Winogradskyella sp. UBA3174]|tara:strand:- start:120505 stop:120861 length:357 start_codon:yes stop_codon:yes gene_type:complete
MMGSTNTDWVQMTDLAIIEQIGHFIKNTRLSKNKTQKQLALASGLNRWTISQIENGESVTLTSLIQLLRALDVLYVLDHFEFSEAISPLAYAKLKKEQRERASGNPTKTTNKKDDLGW